MKVLVLFLCALVAVQGRSTDVRVVNSRSEAALGDNPWVVHLRVAVSTSGLLNSAVGTLISNRWVLTTGDAVENIRFVWLRYGTFYVVNPPLVTEASSAILSPDGKLALININRDVEFTDNISSASLSSAVSTAEAATFCHYGKISDDVPGETRACNDVSLTTRDDGFIVATSDDVTASKFDLGAPVVADGVAVALLVEAGDDEKAGVFLPVADYVEWIAETTGLSIE